MFIGRRTSKPKSATSHLTFNGRPGPSTAIFLSHGTWGTDLSPAHISGEQSAVMASSRSSTQFAIGPAVGWMIRCPDLPSYMLRQRGDNSTKRDSLLVDGIQQNFRKFTQEGMCVFYPRGLSRGGFTEHSLSPFARAVAGRNDPGTKTDTRHR